MEIVVHMVWIDVAEKRSNDRVQILYFIFVSSYRT